MLSRVASRSPRRDFLSRLRRDVDQHAGGRGADQSAILGRHAMWPAVDLHQRLDAVPERDDLVKSAADPQPPGWGRPNITHR
jgi:hypothetical protein